MADFGRGIKAGVAVAAIYLVISVILAAIGLYASGLIYAAGLSISPGLMDSPFVIYSILAYIIRGIVFGAVFAAMYNYLPTVTSIVKGLLLSLFFWILTVVQVIYTTLGWAWPADGFSGSGTYYSGNLSLSSVGLTLAGIISALAFGALTGFLWDRFRGKELAEERKGRPVLLVSFIQGGVLWVLGAMAFFRAVVIFGGSAIDPDFWWYSVLYTASAFLGLPGWVLTFIAWKKTRRGESGLKWGVAGGVIMALVGHLLPGALAIAGGLFSRHKLASESSTAEIEQ
jgi:hypothetical protein